MLLKTAVLLMASVLVHNAHAYPDHIWGFGMGVKGATESSITDLENSFCTMSCVLSGLNEVNGILNVDVIESFLKLDTSPLIDMFGNKTQLSGFCQTYNSFRSCNARCPDSNLQTLVEGGQNVIDFFCVDRYEDILQHFPCVSTVPSKRPCYGKCLEYFLAMRRVAAELSSKFQMTIDRSKAEKSESFVRNMCNEMKCQAGCHSPAVREECGADADKLLHDMTEQPIAAFAALLLENGVINKTPSSCVIGNGVTSVFGASAAVIN